jgi:hypothetical protein
VKICRSRSPSVTLVSQALPSQPWLSYHTSVQSLYPPFIRITFFLQSLLHSLYAPSCCHSPSFQNIVAVYPVKNHRSRRQVAMFEAVIARAEYLDSSRRSWERLPASTSVSLMSSRTCLRPLRARCWPERWPTTMPRSESTPRTRTRIVRRSQRSSLQLRQRFLVQRLAGQAD